MVNESQLPFVLPPSDKEDEPRNNEFVTKLLDRLIHCRNPRNYLLVLCLVHGLDVEAQFGKCNRTELINRLGLKRANFYELMRKIQKRVNGKRKAKWHVDQIAKLIELLKEI